MKILSLITNYSVKKYHSLLSIIAIHLQQMTNPKSKISKNVPNTIKLRNLVVFFYYKERGGNAMPLS